MQIVFLARYSDYISEGYDVSALHDLVMPVHREKLFPVLDRAVDRQKTTERFLTLKCDGALPHSAAENSVSRRASELFHRPRAAAMTRSAAP